MNVIVEIPRPYTEDVFEYLEGEGVLIVSNHAFWCATPRICRVVAHIANLDDAIWVCGVLNDSAIADSLKNPHRRDRFERHHLQEVLDRFIAQQQIIGQNPALMSLMDDSNELNNKIEAVRLKIARLGGGN